MSEFKKESQFEKELVNSLIKNGWTGFSQKSFSNKENIEDFNKQNKVVLYNVSEKELNENLKNIIFINNKEKLNNIELTDTEMEQIIQKFNQLGSFVQANKCLNGEYITIKRDNPKHIEKYGKEVFLYIFGRKDISAGKSVYQVARQVQLPGKRPSKRADLMLLINGIPIIHIELKKDNESIGAATTQIKNYASDKSYTGIFSLVQILVAMQPNKMVYTPNITNIKNLNHNSFYSWTNFDNIEITHWQKVVENFLCIPMAHRLISDFSIPDSQDNELKILRGYQFHAINSIEKKFKNLGSKIWEQEIEGKNIKGIKGGHVWHTTGSGKTLTSFKLGHLLLDYKYADLVIFVVDRTELGTQTFREFGSFGDQNSLNVLKVKSTKELVKTILKNSNRNALIISSIQKQNNINPENFDQKTLEKLKDKRVVFIFDECHRSTFGLMYDNIINSFPKSILFGFTGTPIKVENNKNGLSTIDNFGPELHKYTIKNGIYDKKVLPFNVNTIYFKDSLTIFLNLTSPEEISEDKELNKEELIQKVLSRLDENEKNSMNSKITLLSSCNSDENSQNIKIEDTKLVDMWDHIFFKYDVVMEIIKHWKYRSSWNYFSGILAVNSINDAIKYFNYFNEKIKETRSNIKHTVLFDPSIDMTKEDVDYKKDALVDILQKYNVDFGTNYNFESYKEFKTDVANRLAHKGRFINIEPTQRLDLLIVVDQMLTGFDSKYINTIYFDKIMEYEHLIQAISRTNRVLDNNKPFGSVYFYRKPNTMKKNLDEALKIYAYASFEEVRSKDIKEYINKISENYKKIKEIFKAWGFEKFESIPIINENHIEEEERAKFKKLVYAFLEMHNDINSAKILGFTWGNSKELELNEDDFLKIKARVKDIPRWIIKKPGTKDTEPTNEIKIAFDYDEVFSEYNTFNVDNSYINDLLQKIIDKRKNSINIKEELEKIDDELNKLSSDLKKYGEECIKPFKEGNYKNLKDFKLKDCIYIKKEQTEQKEIEDFCEIFNINKDELKNIINSYEDINANGRFEHLTTFSFNDSSKEYVTEVRGYPKTKPARRSDVNDFIKEWIEKKRNNRN
ncbi:HsdR family type I site-specific deoxyribonuclease [Mycoplasmopsis felis]|uniref:HsdR family type I site-specific deoxyribonuclease n=1 Tax=Mycoplasmopsis felis TaxID=33923 RepID=UPI002AFEB2E2|nr:HsdR family type I site-specific deoxyribonuclease [Mycoplasmopsis felis]WQQ08869.1 HsdR family type I site-specific deoxyribonuclease [Mycoplasmopsis felis]